MTDTDYFKSRAIGSSLLADCIARIDPLEICTDRATVAVKPTAFMEAGKMFEDLVEQEFSGNDIFDNRYFKSDISAIPEYKGNRTDIRQVLDILDDPQEEIEVAIEDAYIRKADGSLHGSYKQRHRCLDQIKAHDYRRPIPEPFWKKLFVMLERFKNYPFEIGTSVATIKDWLTMPEIHCDFQVDHFWKHESGAECREKLDMVWTWQSGAGIWAMPLDLKVTANYLSFEQNWKYRYIWQSKHYMEGFKSYCAEKGFIPCPQIWYVVQESAKPYITHARALSASELDSLSIPYDQAIPQIWEWIEAGKPIKGYTKQQTVNRWGKPEEEL
jgi:hypothetical protein